MSGPKFGEPGWRPYCLRCSTMWRMEPHLDGFKCNACGNEIGADLKRRRDPVEELTALLRKAGAVPYLHHTGGVPGEPRCAVWDGGECDQKCGPRIAP